MKKVWYVVLAALVGALLVAVWFQRRGSVASVRLSDKYVDEVTSVRFLYPDGSSFASSDINKDFLHVLNLWEIDEILSDSVARALRAQAPLSFSLKCGRRTVYRKRGYLADGDFFLDAGRKGLYKMRCDYLSHSWPEFFMPESPLWKNRLLLDLYYYNIRSLSTTFFPAGDSYKLLRVDNGDSVRYVFSRPGLPEAVLPAAQAQSYLSACKQVYFDPLPASFSDSLGPAVYSLHIETLDGQHIHLAVHPYDLFKALVTTPTDTLLVPHVALDKLIAFTHL